MDKCIFIIPYYGKFNNYFQLFLNSCKSNIDYNWIIFTDDTREFDYPENVRVVYNSFGDLKEIIRKKFHYEISIDYPYKLCDYKPLYGYIFSDYIVDYNYWGHCDTDLIFGNINDFLSKVDYEKYDKLFFLGHCTIYKKTDEINSIIINSKRTKEVLQSKMNCSFDEEFNNSINNILIENNRKIFLREYEANIYMKSSNFHLTNYDFEKEKYIILKRKNHFFVWENGNLFEIAHIDNKVKKREYLYIHFQSRRMNNKVINPNRYMMIPNAFEDINDDYMKNFNNIKKKNFNMHYFRLRLKNLKIKIKRKIKRNRK